MIIMMMISTTLMNIPMGAINMRIIPLAMATNTTSIIDFDYEGCGMIRLYRTKNKNERTEFLMPNTREPLVAWKDHVNWMRHRKRIRPTDTNYVFCRLDGTPIKRFD